MPLRWIHCTLDLIAFGRTCPEIHKRKDESCKDLGAKHRFERHGFYLFCRRHREPFENLLPLLMECFNDLKNSQGGDKAEEAMVDASHEQLDYTWDEPSFEERKYWEGFFAWVVLQPEILREKFGVDVVKGRIKRRLDCGQEIWEETPEIINEYNELRKEVEMRIRRDEDLRTMLALYGS